MSEWQPIETAPKNTDSILLRAGSVMEIACWGDYCVYNNPKFTHWYPLPQPPKQEISNE